MNKQRAKTNALTTAINITYYGGTIGAGLAFYRALNNTSALAITTLIVFLLTVEGILRTVLDEVGGAVTRRWNPTPATAAADPKGTDR